jgi:hypothetical protein
MCARKETDVRESLNDSTFAGGERQGSHGETCYAMFDENPFSSLPECGVWLLLRLHQKRSHFIKPSDNHKALLSKLLCFISSARIGGGLDLWKGIHNSLKMVVVPAYPFLI